MADCEMSNVQANGVDSMSLCCRPHPDRRSAFRSLVQTGAYSRLATSAATLADA